MLFEKELGRKATRNHLRSKLPTNLLAVTEIQYWKCDEDEIIFSRRTAICRKWKLNLFSFERNKQIQPFITHLFKNTRKCITSVHRAIYPGYLTQAFGQLLWRKGIRNYKFGLDQARGLALSPDESSNLLCICSL